MFFSDGKPTRPIINLLLSTVYVILRQIQTDRYQGCVAVTFGVTDRKKPEKHLSRNQQQSSGSGDLVK